MESARPLSGISRGVNHPSARPRTQAPGGSGAASGPPLFLGVDLGKVTTSLAVGELGADGELRVLETRAERHLGDPLRPFLELYRELDAGRLAGRRRHRRLRRAPRRARPRRRARGDRPGAGRRLAVPGRTAQRRPGRRRRLLGAHARRRRRRAATRPTSAARPGTGETVEGLCARLGRSLDDAVALAEASPDGVTVTSRCAVFAKSELTHFANQGESHGRIFRGLFEGVARNVHSLYDKSKIDGPVVLIGHGALIAPIAAGVAALSDGARRGRRAGRRVRGARRAALRGRPRADGDGRRRAVRRRTAASRPPVFPADPQALVRPVRSRIGRLEPARRGSRLGRAPRATRRAAPAPATERAPAVLGLDLGSTGSKAALARRRHRRRPGERLPAHRGQPRRGGAGAGRRGRRDGAAPGGRRRPHRLRPRRRGDRVPRRLPGPRRAPHGAERDRRPRHGRRARSTRTAAAASPSSRSAARTPSSSTSRTAASSTPT